MLNPSGYYYYYYYYYYDISDVGLYPALHVVGYTVYENRIFTSWCFPFTIRVTLITLIP